MFEIPRVFGAFDTLFKNLGTRQAPTRADYVLLLQELSFECGDDELNINELTTVLNIIQLVADSEEHNDGAHVVHVPDQRARLVPASQCLFNDSPWIARRIEQTKVNLVYPTMARRLCTQLGVCQLSLVLREELHVAGAVDGTAKASLASAVAVLHSVAFAQGLVRLLEDQAARQQNYSQWIDLPSPLTVATILAEYTVTYVCNLSTTFVMADTGFDVTIPGAAGQCALKFIDEQKQIFIATNAMLRPSLLLALAINSILQTRLPGVEAVADVSPIAAMLELQEAGHVHALLESLEIYKVDHDALRRGVPGEELCSIDVDMLALNPLRQYLVGETVVVQPEGTGPSRYAKVSKVVEGSVLSTMTVSLGRGRLLSLLSSEVYSFRTRSTQNSGGALATNTLTSPTIGHGISVAPRPNASHVDSEEVQQSETNSDGNEQVIGALTALQAKLNLPLGLEQQELIRGHLMLQEQLQASDKQLEEARAASVRICIHVCMCVRLHVSAHPNNCVSF
jgi:hypothetical protein